METSVKALGFGCFRVSDFGDGVWGFGILDVGFEALGF